MYSGRCDIDVLPLCMERDECVEIRSYCSAYPVLSEALTKTSLSAVSVPSGITELFAIFVSAHY